MIRKGKRRLQQNYLKNHLILLLNEKTSKKKDNKSMIKVRKRSRSKFYFQTKRQLSRFSQIQAKDMLVFKIRK